MTEGETASPRKNLLVSKKWQYLTANVRKTRTNDTENKTFKQEVKLENWRRTTFQDEERLLSGAVMRDKEMR